MEGYQQKKWSDKFVPEIKSIIGSVLVAPSSLELDMRQNTDFVVMNTNNLSIAARVRRYSFYERFKTQFTIRCFNNGAKTELKKIEEGWGDWLFYGIADKYEKSVFYWHILDLEVMRQNGGSPKVKHGTEDNGDGTMLMWFEIDSFPPELVVASSEDKKMQAYASLDEQLLSSGAKDFVQKSRKEYPHLAPCPSKDFVWVSRATCHDCRNARCWEHPSLLSKKPEAVTSGPLLVTPYQGSNQPSHATARAVGQ